jgi:hypothetical protein
VPAGFGQYNDVIHVPAIKIAGSPVICLSKAFK